MSEHRADLSWRRRDHETEAGTYSRNHTVTLNGGQSVKVSASVEYLGDAQCADPEQLLISSLSSCHMLFFIAVAERRGFKVDSYKDSPVGYLEKTERGGMSVTRIELSPEVTFQGDREIDAETLSKIHHSAHRNCFIANSLNAEVSIDGML